MNPSKVIAVLMLLIYGVIAFWTVQKLSSGMDYTKTLSIHNGMQVTQFIIRNALDGIWGCLGLIVTMFTTELAAKAIFILKKKDTP